MIDQGQTYPVFELKPNKISLGRPTAFFRFLAAHLGSRLANYENIHSHPLAKAN